MVPAYALGPAACLALPWWHPTRSLQVRLHACARHPLQRSGGAHSRIWRRHSVPDSPRGHDPMALLSPSQRDTGAIAADQEVGRRLYV